MFGNLVVLALVTLVSAYAIMQLGRMREITRRIIHVHSNLIDLNKEMTGALLSETRYEKKFALLRDQTLYENFLRSKGDFERYLNEALLLADDPRVTAALRQAEELNRVYGALVEREARSPEAGVVRKRRAREKERLVDRLVEELARLRTMSQKSILTNATELDDTGRRARTVAAVITAVALLSGIALSIAVTRSITVPLARMRKKTAEIAEGVFEPDLEIGAPPEMRALAAAFNSMCSRLREVDRLKADFYSLMSHELRTPLTSIREGTNLFLEGAGGDVTERQRELLVIISEESSRLIDLVGSLLELSKLEAGGLALNPAPAHLPRLVTRVVREVTPLATAKEIRIDWREECGMPLLSVDSERILQVLRNLIGNALKFTPPGGTVRIAAESAGGAARLSVTDTGPGIPENELGVIFDKFRQATATHPPRFPGTGLGLAIVRHIVEAHGGTIWVESETGRGSTFTFVLPLSSES
jgi:two-component system sensor histidine kinase GlrK